MNKRLLSCIILSIILFLPAIEPGAMQDDGFLENHRWNYFISLINNRIQEFPGKAGVIVKDLTNNNMYAYNADQPFISASLIKLPIMVAVFKEFNDDRLSLTDTHVLKDKHRVAGSGILKYKKSGTRFSIYELVYIMISNSDNTAARMLTEIIGYDRMNRIFKSIGLTKTNISPQSFNLKNGEIAGDSFTTPRDIARLLDEIYARNMFRRYLSQQMIDILKLTVDKKRLNKYLPASFTLAHKTGLLRGACHDAGIVFSPGGDFLICILTDNNGNYREAKRFIANLGKLTFKQMKKQ